MEKRLDPLDIRVLDEWQRDFPLNPRPFSVMAEALACSEADVIARLKKLKATGRISRVGGTCTPNTISASTLAAVAAPPEQVEDVAEMIGRHKGVNHSYLRENKWNLWFVATGPDRDHVEQILNTPYRKDIFQDRYFIIDSYEQVYNSIDEIKRGLNEKVKKLLIFG